MEKTFESLKESGKNTVDAIVQWLKDSTIIDSTPEAEENAYSLFEDCKDKACVQVEEMKKSIAKLAEEQKKTPEDIYKKMEDTSSLFMATLGQAANKLVGADLETPAKE